MSCKTLRRSSYLMGTFLVIVLLAGGCRHKDENNLDMEAKDLFENSIRLIKSYSDSISTAADTARIEYLANAFDNRMTALNFKYPADTDLSLSEEENDSLIKMISRIVELRQQRLKELDKNLHLAVDTVEVKTE